jgi:hypothetical protein
VPGTVKTFAQAAARHDQVTRFTQVRTCEHCRKRVLHHQVADFDRATGFKSYSWIPTAHRCTKEKTRP